jgi:hypothetical protein
MGQWLTLLLHSDVEWAVFLSVSSSLSILAYDRTSSGLRAQLSRNYDYIGFLRKGMKICFHLALLYPLPASGKTNSKRIFYHLSTAVPMAVWHGSKTTHRKTKQFKAQGEDRQRIWIAEMFPWHCRIGACCNGLY